MDIFNISEADALPCERTAVALGNFDGVHLGHCALLKRVVELAESRNEVPSVFTFIRHPALSLGRICPKLITENEDKAELFAAHGIKRIYAADFESVRHYSPEAFVCEVLKAKLHADVAVCGYNFRFGENGSGSPELLTSLMHGNTEVIPPIIIRNHPVSSTLIRQAIESGDVEYASEMLGRPYSISFPVVHGKELGRTIGLPTINQDFPERHVIPSSGVYAVIVTVDHTEYLGVANVGNRPTVDNDGRINCETHIIGFNGWLYGRPVKVSFYKKLRDEIKFSSLDRLKAQINTDIEDTKTYFKK